MKVKKLSAYILIGAMLISVPVFARGGGHGSYGNGYMGGKNSSYTQQSGSQQSYKGYGDGTMPRPMDGTGFGVKNNKGRGKRLRDGSCGNSTTTATQ